MAKIIAFPRVDGAAASSSTTIGLSRAELRDTVWTNFYRAERQVGVAPEIAYQRADAHAERFDQLLNNIGQLMSEAG
ncbi:hydroxyethylthiazole kinase-like sugar kinase family protein [Bradyrhizobium sp. GM0.4]